MATSSASEMVEPPTGYTQRGILCEFDALFAFWTEKGHRLGSSAITGACVNGWNRISTGNAREDKVAIFDIAPYEYTAFMMELVGAGLAGDSFGIGTDSFAALIAIGFRKGKMWVVIVGGVWLLQSRAVDVQVWGCAGIADPVSILMASTLERPLHLVWWGLVQMEQINGFISHLIAFWQVRFDITILE